MADELLAVAPAPLRRQLRESIPFEVRIGVRRAPALLRWLGSPDPTVRTGPLPVSLCERSSPLRRPGTTYEAATQRAKEANVARVAAALDGVVVEAGATWSWHATVGPPLQRRGFVPGPELHDGAMALGAGGGACQAANLVFWLGVMSGMDVVERHRHQQDLFPDSDRDVPFGCGATVFWPHRDLKLRNPHDHRLQLGVGVGNGRLVGQVRADRPLDQAIRLVETAHHFVRHRGEVWRLNTISREIGGESPPRLQVLVHNRARVAYDVADDLVEEW